MTIKEAIKRAESSGWEFYSTEHGCCCGNPNGNCGREHVYCYSTAFLDPSFWQSLGKALGWGTTMFPLTFLGEDGVTLEYLYWKGQNGHRYTPHVIGWKKEWHRFIDHLATGGTPEAFFEGLK